MRLVSPCNFNDYKHEVVKMFIYDALDENKLCSTLMSYDSYMYEQKKLKIL